MPHPQCGIFVGAHVVLQAFGTVITPRTKGQLLSAPVPVHQIQAVSPTVFVPAYQPRADPNAEKARKVEADPGGPNLALRTTWPANLC